MPHADQTQRPHELSLAPAADGRSKSYMIISDHVSPAYTRNKINQNDT